MPKNISKRDMLVNGKVSGWDKIISDAELHIVRLKAAIRHARDMKKLQEPCSLQSSDHQQEQQHSV